MAPGDENLTVSLLRAEIRAARAEDRNEFFMELDKRLKPVHDHIAAINRGEFTDGFKAGILRVVGEQVVSRWTMKANKAVVYTAIVALATLATNIALIVH